jgi:sugar O-acyltransferase (sialic acid O-acetyltransferase NeuD family)
LKTIDKIVVVGAVGTALNILYQIKDAIVRFGYKAEIKGIIIDDREQGAQIGDFSVIGPSGDIPKFIRDTDYKFIFCLYRMDKMEERSRLLESFKIPYERFINFIHPLAYVSPDLELGQGNVILSNSTVQAGVTIGNNNIINSNITIEHNTTIGNSNFFSANSCIGAKVKIGNNCFFGLNSSVRENVTLAGNVFVGMHSLVLDDFSNVQLAGIPAKITERKKD